MENNNEFTRRLDPIFVYCASVPHTLCPSTLGGRRVKTKSLVFVGERDGWTVGDGDSVVVMPEEGARRALRLIYDEGIGIMKTTRLEWEAKIEEMNGAKHGGMC